MGGLISAPKPIVVAAPTETAQAEAVQQATAQTEVAAEDAAREARLKAAERARRGLLGTIATSERGVLDAAGGAITARKSLLGE